MNVRDAIRRAAPVLAQHGQVDSEFLLAWLLRAGLSKEQAHDAVRFIPLAFGRDVLEGVGVVFSDTYLRIAGAESAGEERALNDEPFFREALSLAPLVASEIGFDAFNTVAMQSSEFQAINNALNAGAQVENLVASPPAMMYDATTAAPAKRPWWKLWG
jgi:hypothetical protein